MKRSILSLVFLCACGSSPQSDVEICESARAEVMASWNGPPDVDQGMVLKYYDVATITYTFQVHDGKCSVKTSFETSSNDDLPADPTVPTP